MQCYLKYPLYAHIVKFPMFTYRSIPNGVVLGMRDMISTAILDVLAPRQGMISSCSYKIKLEDRRGMAKMFETNFNSRRSQRVRKTRSNSDVSTVISL